MCLPVSIALMLMPPFPLFLSMLELALKCMGPGAHCQCFLGTNFLFLIFKINYLIFPIYFY